MGLFDTIANALNLGGSGQSQQGSSLGSLLQQGGPGASGGIVGALLSGIDGGGSADGQDGMAGMLETLAANGLARRSRPGSPTIPICR